MLGFKKYWYLLPSFVETITVNFNRHHDDYPQFDIAPTPNILLKSLDIS